MWGAGTAGRPVGPSSKAEDDLAPGVSLSEIPESFGSLAELVTPVDDRCHRSGLEQPRPLLGGEPPPPSGCGDGLLLDKLQVLGSYSLDHRGQLDRRVGGRSQVHLLVAEFQDRAAAVCPVDEGG